MYLLVISIHVVLSLVLILIIMLQPGKGGDVGAAFGGGGGSTLFGPRGPGSVLSRITTVVAVGFMGTSIVLSMMSGRALRSDGNLDEVLQQRARERVSDVREAPEEAPILELEEVAPAGGVSGDEGEGEGAETP